MPDGIVVGGVPAAPLLWPGQPNGMLHARDIDALLIWAHCTGASRIALQTDEPVALGLHGRVHKVTSRPLSEDEVERAVNLLYGADGVAHIRTGRAIDVAYEIQRGRSSRLRFRVNATGSHGRGTGAIDAVLRPIADVAPRLSEQRVEQGILDAFCPGNGIVLVGGATGSGKTTLIGGMIRAKLEDPDGHYNIIEGAAPTEILYDQIDRPSSTISQLEIPRDLTTFAEFIAACMRKEPTDIIVGECRDGATMTAAIQAAISGHTLTSTIHTNSIRETVQRIVSLCPADQRDSLTISLATSLRLLINQRLLPSTDGRRTAIREFLHVDRRLRDRLLDSPAAAWPAITQEALEVSGQSYAVAIRIALAEGRITQAVARKAMETDF